MRTIHQILRALPTHARERCLDDIARSWRDSDFAAAAANEIARAVNFRATTVRRAEPQRRARILAGAIPRLAPPFLLDLLVSMHVERRSELLGSVYDALGVAHDGVGLNDEATMAELDAKVVVPRIADLSRTWELEDLWLCMAVMEHRRPDGWAAAVSAAQEDLWSRMAVESPEAEAPAPLPERQAADENATAVPEAPQFTTLDREVIRSTVHTLNNEEGGLGWDELDDLVQEVLELNAERAQSRFHRGFLDAILGRELPRRDAADNAERRAWYLVGFELGLLRQAPDRDTAAALAELSASDRKVLFDSAYPAGAMLGEQLLLSLLERGAFSDATRWIEAHGGRCPDRYSAIVLRWSEDALLEAQEPSALRRVLQAMIDVAASRLGEQGAFLARLLRRRLAIALRLEGRLDRAEGLIEELLETSEDSTERARLVDQQILIRLGVRSLETFELPAESGPRERLLESIERRRPEMLEAASAEPPARVALAAVALPVVAEAHAPEAARAEAATRIRQAIDLMQRGGAVWERSGLLARLRFYVASLDLRSGRADDAASAAGRLVALLQEGARLPSELVLDAIETVALYDVPQVGELAALALARYGHRALTKLDVEDLSRRAPGFRRALAETLERRREELKSDERWVAWDQLLRGALDAVPRDLEAADQALGALEGLSEARELKKRFLDLLEKTDLWDPTWESNERDEARFRVYRDLGHLEEARAVLISLTHASISDGRLGYARDLLELVDELPPDPAAREALWARLDAATRAAAPAPASARSVAEPPVSVFFIGGNETQAAYESQLRQAIRERYPHALLEIEFPGWGANWGRILERIETQIARSDVVVVMRFVRTHLGRAVRRLASRYEKPWVPCTGHGYASLERAIAEAIELAAERGRDA